MSGNMHSERQIQKDRSLPFCYISGGCRSGKSAFAQRLAEDSAPRRLYIATCFADKEDEEMAGRISLHRQARGAGWRHLEPDEASLPNLADLLPGLAAPGEALLLDCLSLWAASCMCAEKAPHDFDERCDKLLRCLWALPNPVFIVNSEVGMGLVPQSLASRTFRDMTGLAGQRAADMATCAIFMVSGLPLVVKGALPALFDR
ncbi:bifunctional adenosylcobinamide kinase/adenosylcobinamide-phosphate guanylyltransferase [Desulfovibrio sp. OttesenSCG-928-M14]|nr:bifunctional adenosylcobinamide kinase/adenosylcobinamide-phosphate guanylyltransferase [Desulfovibrio sp. OttesenSCG-928-M14]